MLLFRMGPRYLFIRTENTEEITSFLELKLNGEITDLQNGFEKSSENSTLCFITDINLELDQGLCRDTLLGSDIPGKIVYIFYAERG